MRRIYSSEVSRTIRFAMEGERNRILPSNIECAVASTYIVAEQCCSCQHDILSSSSSLMACPYWSVAVWIRWRHKMRSSAFLQAADARKKTVVNVISRISISGFSTCSTPFSNDIPVLSNRFSRCRHKGLC